MVRRTTVKSAVGAACAATTAVPPVSGLGEDVDRLYQLREERLALSRRVDDLKEAEKRLTDHVIRELGEACATAVAGNVARAGINTSKIGSVKDWQALTAYVVETADLSVLQRRLNDGYLRERWDAGESVPGVEPFTLVKLSLTKR